MKDLTITSKIVSEHDAYKPYHGLTMPMFYTMLGTGLAINARDMWPGAEKTEPSYKGAPKNTTKQTKQAKKAKKAMPEL